MLGWRADVAEMGVIAFNLFYFDCLGRHELKEGHMGFSSCMLYLGVDGMGSYLLDFYDY